MISQEAPTRLCKVIAIAANPPFFSRDVRVHWKD
jgi:hypothetical protein